MCAFLLGFPLRMPAERRLFLRAPDWRRLGRQYTNGKFDGLQA
jgi:hypothetical protein